MSQGSGLPLSEGVQAPISAEEHIVETRLNYFASSPLLFDGPHTLRVTVTGQHDASSGASFVSIDRAEVWTN